MKEQTTRYFGAIVSVPLYLILLAGVAQAADVNNCANSYKDLTDTSLRTPYLCPGTKTFCVAQYSDCDLLGKACIDANQPFICPAVTVDPSAGTKCVKSPKECCSADGNFLTGKPIYCPHLKTCVPSAADCCSLDPLTPVWCPAQNQCVASQHDCCEGLKQGTQILTKCTYEKKCAQTTSFKYCFKFKNECDPNGRFPYKCMQDGLCKQKAEDCASPRVCPPGYTQCADRSCIPGLGNLTKCKSLNTCRGTVRGDGNALLYARCPDGLTCVTDYVNCPTEVACGQPGLVVCPDGSCQKSADLCLQPPTCKDINKPWLCQGLDSRLCVAKSSDCPAVKNDIVCPKGLLKCQNGQCMESCSQIIVGQGTRQSQMDCKAEGKYYCPNSGECAGTYEECPDQTYCPYVSDYTYSPANVLCGGGAQVCVNNASECSASNCSSSMFYPNISQKLRPFSGFSMDKVKTCPDGRCMQGDCMTPFSCSPGYIKLGGFGEFCVSDYSIGTKVMRLAIQLRANICPPGQVKCLTGQCRNAFDDCPQETTCPAEQPVKCRDGNCVTSKDSCRMVDIAVEANLKKCYGLNKLLCPGDLHTCSISLQHCPVKSTCPFGLMKCSNNTCVTSRSSCPRSVCNPAGDTPYNCEYSDKCVVNLNQCAITSDICPTETPVRCSHIHGATCKRTAQECHLASDDTTPVDNTPVKQDTTSSSCGTVGFVPCKDGCKKYPCPEWITCLKAGDTQCWNGLCVSDKTTCPRKDNGCPFYLPIKCPYSEANCVETIGQCTFPVASEAKVKKAQWCNSKSGGKTPIACLVGNCGSSESACAAEFPATCQEWKYPNSLKPKIKEQLPGIDQSQCLIPQCPFEIPYKCTNGLCVQDKKHCPSVQLPVESYIRCYQISVKQMKDIKVPCGDQSCVARSDQCPPIYSCLYSSTQAPGTQPTQKFRCNDGSCVEKSDDCYQKPRTRQQCTGLHAHLCATGLCAASSLDCLNEVGCPGHRPIRCESSGACMKNGEKCLDDRERMVNFSISKSNNFCRSKGLGHTCMSSNSFTNMMYCSQSMSGCIDNQTLCSQDTPVNCFNKTCGIRINKCAAPVTPSNLRRSFYTKSLSNHAHPMLGKSWKEASEKTICPPNKPFRCSTTSRTACKELPYTSYSTLYDKACPTSVQTVEQVYQANQCLNSETPVSCADGSCAKNKNECSSCPYFCTKIGMCVGSTHECLKIKEFENATACNDAKNNLATVQASSISNNSTDISAAMALKVTACQKYENYFQVCPPGLPYRCITNGQCVQSAKECATGDRIRQRNGVFQQNFVGSLIDSTCSFLTPIRCGAGQCVKMYQECIPAVVNTSGDWSTAFTKPVQWGDGIEESKNTARFCQVICQDGTCRDRQENCPIIQGCHSPLKPHRCNSGYCAKDLAECVASFGSEIENEVRQMTTPSSSCGTGPAPEFQKYIRCEDGICRPAIQTGISSTYTNTCLTFFGCSRTLPYQCQNGSCALSLADCINNHHKCEAGQVQCKNRKCVTSPDECQINHSVASALQLEVSFNPYKDNTFHFAFQGNKAIGRLVLPSNAIHVDVNTFVTDQQIEKDIYQHIIITPVPDNKLEKVKNTIQKAATVYLNKFYSLLDGNLSRADSLIMPAVNLRSRTFHEHSEIEKISNDKDARVEYMLDSSSMPEGLIKKSDICLGLIEGELKDSKWSCVANEWNLTTDGWVSFPFRKGGTYALIVSPDPDLVPASALCGFWCDYQQWFYIGGSGVIFIVIIVVVLVGCLGPKNHPVAVIKPPAGAKPEMIDNQGKTLLKKVPGIQKTKREESSESDGDDNYVGPGEKKPDLSKYQNEEEKLNKPAVVNGTKPGVFDALKQAKAAQNEPLLDGRDQQRGAPPRNTSNVDNRALLTASIAEKQKQTDQEMLSEVLAKQEENEGNGINNNISEESSKDEQEENQNNVNYGGLARDEDSEQDDSDDHFDHGEASYESEDEAQLDEVEKQMKECMDDHGVEYSEGDVGSSSGQDEGKVSHKQTPSIASMAVSAKKGRVSMSNNGSLMGFQQRAAETTQYTHSDFGGRSAGFYQQETERPSDTKFPQQEYEQYKQKNGSPDQRYNQIADFQPTYAKKSFGPGQSQSSRPMNKHGKSATDAISPVKQQQEHNYQSYMRDQDTNIGGYVGGRSNNGMYMQSAHNPTYQQNAFSNQDQQADEYSYGYEEGEESEEEEDDIEQYAEEGQNKK